MELFVNNTDMELLMYIQNYKRNYRMDRLMPIITELGNNSRVWIMFALILLADPKLTRTGLAELLAVSMSAVSSIVIKNKTRRPRPFMEIPAQHLLIPPPHSYSFPSGHAATSFAGAWVILCTFKGTGMPALILASLISYSRLYLFVHYPSDVLAGMFLGLICANIAVSMAEII